MSTMSESTMLIAQDRLVVIRWNNSNIYSRRERRLLAYWAIAWVLHCRAS